MNTNVVSRSAKRTPVVRLFEWLLDGDGEIYGDERDRNAWYEAIAGVASLQWILIPWSLAILVWFVPTSAIWALAVVFALNFVLMCLVFPYLKSRNVNYLRKQTTRKARVMQVLAGLPLSVFLLGCTVGNDLRNGTMPEQISDGLRGGVLGGIVGGAFAFYVIRRKRKSLEAAERGADDE